MSLPKTVQKVFDTFPKQQLGGVNDDYRIIAPRSFRVVLWMRGGLAKPDNNQVFRSLFELFESHYGEQAIFISENYTGSGGRVKVCNSKSVAGALAFLSQSEYAVGAGVRRYGAIVEGMDDPALPYFGLEQFDFFAHDTIEQHTLVEFAVPIDGREVTLGGEVDRIIERAAVISGQAGYGWFLPPALSSQNGLLINRFHALGKEQAVVGLLFVARRTRHHVVDGVTDFSPKRDTKLPAGVVDIGWKTYLGTHLLECVPTLDSALQKSKTISVVTYDKFSVVQAGSVPIWGAPEEADQIEQYRTIVRVLKDVLYPESASLRNAFDDTYLDVHTPYDETKADNLIRSYFKRFD